MDVEDDHPPEIGLEEARQPTLTDFNNKSGLSREFPTFPAGFTLARLRNESGWESTAAKQ